MSRIIDADDFIKRLEEYADRFHAGDKLGYIFGVYDVSILLDQQPTVDMVKHGHWIKKERMEKHIGALNYYCSECKSECDVTFDFCPHCGAKMGM